MVRKAEHDALYTVHVAGMTVSMQCVCVSVALTSLVTKAVPCGRECMPQLTPPKLSMLRVPLQPFTSKSCKHLLL